ncbi:hypothetical protein D3C79_505990 [compost metagenome]
MIGHRHRQRHVDANHAHLNLVAEQTSRFTVTGEDAGAIAILMIIDQLHGLFQAAHAHHAQHRTEDLFFIDAHLRIHVVEQRAAHEIAIFIARHAQATAIHHQLGTGSHAVIDVTHNLVTGCRSHQRPHVQTTRRTSTNLQRLDLRLQLGDQCIGDLITDTHRDRDGHAALAARTIGSPHQGADGVVQVGIGHQHRMVLRATQCLDTFAALGAFGIDVLGNRRRTDKAQCLHLWRFDQRIHGFLVAVHHVEDAFRQSGLQQQLGDEQRRARITLGRLEDECVTASDGQRVHPQRNHGREVEWRDAGNHTQRLEVGPGVDVRADVAAVLTFQHFRRCTGELDVLDTTLQFTRRVFHSLAMLFADHLRDARFVLLQQLLETEHHLGALGRRRIAPGRERSLGRIDGFLNSRAAGQFDLAYSLASGRVEDIGGALTLGNQLAVDQVLNNAHAKLQIKKVEAGARCVHAPGIRIGKISRSGSGFRPLRRTGGPVPAAWC